MRIAIIGTVLLAALHAQAQLTVNPMTSFGHAGSPGWLRPTNGYSYLTVGNTERGLAYGNGQLYLVSRAGGNFIRRLDATTGSDLGALDMTGVIGGTFAINMVGVAADGVIYANNLTTQASTTPYRIYSWMNNSAAPVTNYIGTPLLGGRAGDTFDVIGRGAATLTVSGFGSSPVTNGNNGYAIINPVTGTASQILFSGTPPNAGDFRLGLTFTDASHVMGTPGTSNRYTSFSGTSGTLEGSFAWTTVNQRAMDYAVINGMPILAVMDSGDSNIRLYDATDPANPGYLAMGTTLTLSSVPNVNGVGSVAWGEVTVNPDGTSTADLYALNGNNGIQAFIVTVPEPATAGLIALGGLLFAVRLGRQRC